MTKPGYESVSYRFCSGHNVAYESRQFFALDEPVSVLSMTAKSIMYSTNEDSTSDIAFKYTGIYACYA